VGIEYDAALVAVARQAAADAGFGGDAAREEPAAADATKDEVSDAADSVASLPAEDPSMGRVQIHLADALTADLSAATVVFLYLVPDGMRLLAPRILPLLRSGRVRVVTNAFSLPGCEPVACETYKHMKVRLYTAASVPPDLPVAAPAAGAAGVESATQVVGADRGSGCCVDGGCADEGSVVAPAASSGDDGGIVGREGGGGGDGGSGGDDDEEVSPERLAQFVSTARAASAKAATRLDAQRKKQAKLRAEFGASSVDAWRREHEAFLLAEAQQRQTQQTQQQPPPPGADE
jgi:hypothetical protein